MKIKGIIFDWVGTLSDRENGPYEFTRDLLKTLYPNYRLALVSKRSFPEQGYQELYDFALTQYFQSVVIAREKTRRQFKALARNPFPF